MLTPTERANFAKYGSIHAPGEMEAKGYRKSLTRAEFAAIKNPTFRIREFDDFGLDILPES